MREPLRETWQQAWQQLGAETDGAGLREQLIAAYSEPQRHYHTVQHLEECLTLFSQHQEVVPNPAEVAMALWFHDAVYQVKSKDNELKSAQWADQELAAANVDKEARTRIFSLIMATCHEAIPQHTDECLVVDIDLSILGASPERFAEYEQQVRKEYQWVPALVFKPKRKALLKQFLQRTHIYQTPAIAAEREQQARDNLHWAIQQL